MNTTNVRNNTHCIITILDDLLKNGEQTSSRFGSTLEILDYHITVQRPLERLIDLKPFDINIPAQIIDGWWILSGSNDIEILQQYLPTAQLRSDDDVTWRGGFGPRLRNWHGVDQLNEVRKLILKRPESRRASIALFDPLYDFHESRDVSTTNALHFIVRNNKLHLSVDMRSADALGSSVPGGLASNNLYEWSLLLEVMAFWTGYSIGNLHLYVHSLHIYEKDIETANRIISSFEAHKSKSLYELKPVQKSPFSTSFDQFDVMLERFFDAQRRIATFDHETLPVLGDPLFEITLRYLWHSQNSNLINDTRLSLSDFGSF